MGEILRFDTKLSRAKKQPKQRRMMGDYVIENNLMLLFGATSLGKSVIAMSIAIGISSGAKEILGEVNEFAGIPKKVLYLDGEMSDAQLLGRYEDLGSVPYLFTLDFDEYTRRKATNITIQRNDLETWINETECELIIIDNLGTVLENSQDANQSKELMFMLRSVCREKNVTIIVVSHSTKSVFAGKPTIVNLAQGEGSYKLSAYADHIVALGKTQNSELYLRHLKSRDGQPQDVCKLVTIETDPYLFAVGGDVVPSSELFPIEEFDAVPSKSRGIDYVQLALDIFSEKSQFRYTELMSRLTEITDCKESMAKYYITQMKAKNAILQDGKNFIINRNEVGYDAITEGENYIPLDATVVEVDLF